MTAGLTPEESFDLLIDRTYPSSPNGSEKYDVRCVLRLHRPRGRSFERAICEGCGEGGDAVEWPCLTTQLLAERLGVTL